ncbi:MAG: B12-binding domain-containing radical SAM protein [Candidatus Omnitrophica bacterium]|nr:B12-binding domain-containing radical SAM protein [Candidatus Omnitrophota bacterium]
MNILFIVDTFSIIEPMGVLQLSGITNARGHKSFICAIDDGDVFRKMEEYRIDAVACSFMSTEAGGFNVLVRQIRGRYPNMPIIAGGPHPTYYPKIADTWPVDAVVIGEGDHVAAELLENLYSGKDISHLMNVHTKTFKNPQGNLVEDLDTLAFSDRELLKNVAPFKYIPMKSFFATRGCPYSCSYCFNSAFNKMHKGKGEILRRRSVENLVQELEHVKQNYKMDFVRFGDDTFVMKYDAWVEEFCDKYSKRVGVPFYFLIHPNLASEDLIRSLKKAGCHSIMLGIESGNEQVRRKVLDRYVADATIKKAFALYHKYDIKVFSNTILGLPETTLKEDLESLNFTLDCRPFYSGFTVFTPFPGTALGEYSKQKGYVKGADDFAESFPISMQSGSMLNTVTDRQREIHRNILTLAPVANLFPVLRNLIVKHLIYWKSNVMFDFVGFVVRNYCNMNIFPFGKSAYTFMQIFKKVVRIDKRNYAKDAPPPPPVNKEGLRDFEQTRLAATQVT